MLRYVDVTTLLINKILDVEDRSNLFIHTISFTRYEHIS